jgi:putative membrane protein
MTTAASSAYSRSGTRRAIAAILVFSAAAMAFLFWLIYVHPAMDAARRELTFLPGLDALLNGLSATALLMGFAFIHGPKTWAGRIRAHRTAMMTAFGFSAVFLAIYITNYALHGETIYPGHGMIRAVYLIILISHILLSMICLPLVLITFFLSLSGRIPSHRKVARWTFPIWLYVSVTGVVVYVMLAAAAGV